MDETIIKAAHVSKRYHYGQIGGTTLREELARWQDRVFRRDAARQDISQGSFYALHDVSFSVKKGERVGIIGRNGAGKSTLLKLISRITIPSEGTIDLYGRVASLLEVGTGFHPELTGRENIYLNGAILGMSRKEIDSKLEDIIEFSECRLFIDTPVKRYSSGMYVKLAFSVAVHLDAEIVIMDEVLAVGDQAFQGKCLDKMNEISRSEGRTVLYVSHNMATIRRLCDRVILLENGRMIYDGPVEEGVALYYGGNNIDYPARYDMDVAPRSTRSHGIELRITDFSFPNRDRAIFRSDERIRFSLRFRCARGFDCLGLSFVLQNSMGDKVGFSRSDRMLGNYAAGEIRTFSFEFDPSNLIQGDYLFYLDLFSADRFGNETVVDHPSQSIRFRLLDDASVKAARNAARNGYVKLPPLLILSGETSGEGGCSASDMYRK